MSRILIPLVMLLAGLAIGGGVSTLAWSPMVDRSLTNQREMGHIADQFEAIARKNQAGWNECLTLAAALAGNNR